MNTNSVNTFGQVLRAARLRYHVSEKHQCFVRLSADGPPYQVDLAPLGQHVPDKRGRRKAQQETKGFVIWWDEPSILDEIEPLKTIRGVKKPISFFVNEKGQLVEAA